jgi:hypothetical protein
MKIIRILYVTRGGYRGGLVTPHTLFAQNLPANVSKTPDFKSKLAALFFFIFLFSLAISGVFPSKFLDAPVLCLQIKSASANKR